MTDRQSYNPFDDTIEFHQSIAGNKVEAATDRLLTEQEMFDLWYARFCLKLQSLLGGLPEGMDKESYRDDFADPLSEYKEDPEGRALYEVECSI